MWDSKDNFVKQLYPTKIMKIREFFVWEKTFWKNPKLNIPSDSAYKSIPIISVAFFD